MKPKKIKVGGKECLICPFCNKIIDGKISNIINKRCVCKRCNYSWMARKNPEEIKSCPNCKTRDWK